MRRAIIVLLFFSCWCASVQAQTATVYVSQSGGSVNCGADGTQSTTAVASLTWTAGNTYKLCGTITQNVVVGASGTFSSPITIFFETGANITEATPGNYFNGGVNLQNNSWIIVNGGTPCGWDNATQSTEGTCNGTIHFTANGNSLANQNSALGVNLGSGSNNTVENIEVLDDFVPTGGDSMDASDGQNAACFAIFGGSNYSIHDSQCVGGTYACLYSGAGGKTEINVSYYNNYCNDENWGIAGDTEGTSTGWLIYGNRFGDFAAWSNTSANHHDGIYIWCNPQTTGCGTLSGWNVYNNTFTGTFGLAVTSYFYVDNTQATSNVAFFNNVIAPTDVQSGGGSGYTAMYPGGASTYAQYNNTYLVQTGSNAFACYEGGSNGASLRVAFENNLQQNCAPETTVYTPITFNPIDYNIYATCQTGFTTDCWTYQTNPVSFASWQADVGGESHSKYYPSTTAGLTPSYTPQSGSVAIGAGANLTTVCSGQPNPGLGALCFDAAGNARPSSGSGPWDVGAFQSTSTSSTVSPPTNLIATPK